MVYSTYKNEKEIFKMMMSIEMCCPICGCVHYVYADEVAIQRWQAGELAQNALPDLLPTEREQLISGLCPECQADIFGDEDEPSDADFEEYGDPDMGFDPYMGCYTDDC